MFQIINSFIEGELTDEQCKHCLAATNLGMQYIFVSEKAVSQAKLIERCYISHNEREYYKNIRLEESKLGANKVKLARKQYRGKGQYILPYHTLDPSQAIERILEAKGLLLDEEAELQRQYEIFKRIRMGSK